MMDAQEVVMPENLVPVSSSTIAAAQLRVAVDKRLGRSTPPVIVKIANAKRRNPLAARPAEA